MAELNPEFDLTKSTENDYLLNDTQKKNASLILERKILDIIETPKNILLVDIKTSKENALLNIWKLLNQSFEFAILGISTNSSILNNTQEVYFYAINMVNKKVKIPQIKINNNLFRFYCSAIFKNKNEIDLLKFLTGWSVNKVFEENFTSDMKLLAISIGKVDEENNLNN